MHGNIVPVYLHDLHELTLLTCAEQQDGWDQIGQYKEGKPCSTPMADTYTYTHTHTVH